LLFQWYKNKDDLKAAAATNKHASGGDCKPTLVYLEDILADEIINLHLQKINVSESFIAARVTTDN
jgi:hypothetical protein